jgi:hypothetical protein
MDHVEKDKDGATGGSFESSTSDSDRYQKVTSYVAGEVVVFVRIE